MLDKNLDILDFYRGKLSLRRLSMVVRMCCRDPRTALYQALVDPFSPSEHLLATLVDVSQMANWQRSGDAKAKRPEPWPRPKRRVEAEEQQTTMRDRATALRDRTRQRSAVTDG